MKKSISGYLGALFGSLVVSPAQEKSVDPRSEKVRNYISAIYDALDGSYGGRDGFKKNIFNGQFQAGSLIDAVERFQQEGYLHPVTDSASRGLKHIENAARAIQTIKTSIKGLRVEGELAEAHRFEQQYFSEENPSNNLEGILSNARMVLQQAFEVAEEKVRGFPYKSKDLFPVTATQLTPQILPTFDLSM